jgi:hypothetical protein
VGLQGRLSCMEAGWARLGLGRLCLSRRDANCPFSALPQVAAPCVPPSSHELVVSDSPCLPLLAPPAAPQQQLALDLRGLVVWVLGR